MKTKLDIAIERIIEMTTDRDRIYDGYSDELYREVRWEIATAISEMSFREMVEFYTTFMEQK